MLHWGWRRDKCEIYRGRGFGLIQLISVLIHYNHSGLFLRGKLWFEKGMGWMNRGQARGMHSRWKSWTNGPVMCPLWGLCCGLSPARQSRDELSMYSHPLAGWSREDSLSSGLDRAPIRMGHKGGKLNTGQEQGTAGGRGGSKTKKEVNWSELGKDVASYYSHHFPTSHPNKKCLSLNKTITWSQQVQKSPS